MKAPVILEGSIVINFYMPLIHINFYMPLIHINPLISNTYVKEVLVQKKNSK